MHTRQYEKEENSRAQLTTDQVAEIRRRSTLAYRQWLTKGGRPPGRADDPDHQVTAPLEAEPTSFAYFASAPLA